MAKPFLRWAGSKKRLIPELRTHWNTEPYSRYLEPFTGSGQLFFALSPDEAILSDVNADLINTYNEIKHRPQAIINELKKLPVSKEEYYKIRSIDPNKLPRDQRAARFIYLNRFCFNGLYRTNLKGQFNVPFAGYKTGNIPNAKQLIEVSKSLQSVKLICDDFELVVRQNVKKGDFIYFDPPYAVSNVRMFRQYNPQTFGLKDLKRLADLLEELDEKQNKFLVSYADCPEALEFLSKWNIKRVTTQRYMKGFGKGDGKAKEVLVYN